MRVFELKGFLFKMYLKLFNLNETGLYYFGTVFV